MTTYVLDASVAAKWFLPPAREPLSTEALRLLQDHIGGKVRFLVPDLFWPECGNILWKGVRNRRFSRESAMDAIQDLEGLRLETAPTRPLLKQAFEIAAADNGTVYDAAYVALAVAASVLLVTADERLVNALAGRYPVRWLGAL